jgi:hypothetical protein
LWLQLNGFLSFKNVTPNFILIFFIIFSFILPFRDIKYMFYILIGMTFVSFLWFPFWAYLVFMAGLIGILFGLIKKFLSGDIFIDFLLACMIGTFSFYLISYFLSLGVILWPVIIFEIIYNILIGELIIFIISRK